MAGGIDGRMNGWVGEWMGGWVWWKRQKNNLWKVRKDESRDYEAAVTSHEGYDVTEWDV